MYHESASSEPVERYELDYTIPTQLGPNGEPVVGHCAVRIWRNGAETVAVCTDTPGSSVFPGNFSEHIANIVWERAGKPAQFLYVEQSMYTGFPPQVVPFREEDGHLVDVSGRYKVPTDSFIGRILADDYLEL